MLTSCLHGDTQGTEDVCRAILRAKLLDRQPSLSEFADDHNVDGDFLLYAGKDGCQVMEGSFFRLNYVNVISVIMSASSCCLGQDRQAFPADEVFTTTGADITSASSRSGKEINLKKLNTKKVFL